MTDERDPEPGFETTLREAQAGRAPMDDVVAALAGAAILVPSGADFRGAPEKFQPLLFPSSQGDQLMGVFTAMDRASRYRDMAPFVATVSGRRVLAGLQPGSGVVINPGSRLGMEIPPSAVAGILAAMPPDPPEPAPILYVERAILDSRLGALPHDAVMATLVGSSLFIASSTKVTGLLSDVTPLVLDHEGQGYVAVFTRLEYLTPFSEQAPYALHTQLQEFCRVLTPAAGIIINPGLDWAYLLQPSDVAALRPPPDSPAG